ncbi:homing endonuclease associated repeat-containing protein [Streptomyces goshikiensis]
MHAAHVPAPMKSGPVVYADRELLCVLIRLALGEGTLGRRTFEQRRRGAGPSAALYKRGFGSWNRALELAGLNAVAQARATAGCDDEVDTGAAHRRDPLVSAGSGVHDARGLRGLAHGSGESEVWCSVGYHHPFPYG